MRVFANMSVTIYVLTCIYILESFTHVVHFYSCTWFNLYLNVLVRKDVIKMFNQSLNQSVVIFVSMLITVISSHTSLKMY